MSILGTLPMSSRNVTRGHSPHILNVLFPIYFFTQPFLYFLVGATCKKPLHQDYKKPKSTPSPTAKPAVSRQMENIFIDALVQAASRRQHTRLPSKNGILSNPAFTRHKTRRRHPQGLQRQTRKLHVSPRLARNAHNQALVSREECIQMVDYYDFYRETYNTLTSSVEPEQPLTFEPTPIIEEPDTKYNRPSKSESEENECRHDDRNINENLTMVLRDENATHEAIYEAYSALPSPKVSRLSNEIVRLLLRRLSVVEKKTKEAMLRYFSVLDDMKAAGLPLREAEWNSAIAYAGRCFARVGAAEVESALRIWKEMEKEAGVQSGKVTFNILFDIAAKAGKYVLAEMILKEMEARNLRINRYARVGFIYYHGLKGDGQGVRSAYRDFVESGGIVDVVVMNCVITSLIRAGELPAAEHVYERMKHLLSEKTGAVMPSMSWKDTRELGRVLDRAARIHKEDPERLQQIRNDQYLGPNLQTYAIFVEYHSTQTGELRRIATLLEEMQMLGVPMHGRIFLKIFKGFAHHGGIRYTSWTKARLENVWKSLLSVLDEKQKDVHVMKWMAIWVIRAFGKCCGRQRTLEIWEELRTKWNPDAGESDAVEHTLRNILRPQGAYEERPDQEMDEA